MKKLTIIYCFILGIVIRAQSQTPTPLLLDPTAYPCTTNVTTNPQTPWATLQNTAGSGYAIGTGNLYKENWMQNKFNWYGSNTSNGFVEYYAYPTNNDPSNRLISPFGPAQYNLPGISGFTSRQTMVWIPDNKPSDGWELIKQDLGYFNNDNLNGAGVATPNIEPSGRSSVPYLILYNKFKGLLRVIAYSDLQTANFVRVKLYIDSHNFYDVKDGKTDYDQFSGLLNTYANSIALDQLTSVPNVSVFASKNPDKNFTHPIVADFNLAYDPCTCFLSSGLAVEFSEVDQSSLTALSNDQLDPNDPTQVPSFYASVLTGAETRSDVPNETNTTANGGIMTFISIDDMATKLTAFSQSQESQSENLTLTPSDALHGLSVAFGVAGSLTTDDPEATGALQSLSLVTDFVSGLAGSMNSTPNATPVSYGAIAGTITKIYTPHLIKFAMPGSQSTIDNPRSSVTDNYGATDPTQTILTNEYFQTNNSTSTTNYPMYNEALGNFALLKTPTINVSFYNYPEQRNPFGVTNGGETQITFQLPINSDNIKYAFNPAVKLNKSNGAKGYKILAAIEVDRYYNSGSLSYKNTPTTNFLYLYNDLPKGDHNTAKYISPFVPLECLGDVTPVLHFAKDNGSLNLIDDYHFGNTATNGLVPFPDKYNVNLKLIVMMDFDQIGSTGKNVSSILIYTIPLKVNPTVPSNKFNGNQLNPTPFDLGVGIPNTLAITSNNFTYTTPQTIAAWNTINITGNLSNNSNTVTLQAGDQVVQSGESSIQGEFILQNGEPNNNITGGGCTTLSEVSASEITNFCKGTGNLNYVYQANTPSFTPVARQEAEASNVSITRPSPVARQFGIPNLTAIPNPTNGQVTFYYKVPTDGEVSISINNILGTKITDVLKNEFKPTGQYQKQLDLSQLAVGVYMVTIETNGYKQTERLVISR